MSIKLCPDKKNPVFKAITEKFNKDAAYEFFVNYTDGTTQLDFERKPWSELDLFTNAETKDLMFLDSNDNQVNVKELLTFYGNEEQTLSEMKEDVDELRKTQSLAENPTKLMLAFQQLHESEGVSDVTKDVLNKFIAKHRKELFGVNKVFVDPKAKIEQVTDIGELNEEEQEDFSNATIESQSGSAKFDNDKKASDIIKTFNFLYDHFSKLGILDSKKKMLELSGLYVKWRKGLEEDYSIEDLKDWLLNQTEHGFDIETIAQILAVNETLKDGIWYAHAVLNGLGSLIYTNVSSEKIGFGNFIETNNFERSVNASILEQTVELSLSNFRFLKPDKKSYYATGSESLYYAHQEYLKQLDKFKGPENRKKRFEIDLKFINAITGTDWSYYFNPKMEIVYDENGQRIHYNSFENLLERKNKEGQPQRFRRRNTSEYNMDSANIFYAIFHKKLKEDATDVWSLNGQMNPSLVNDLYRSLSENVNGIESNIIKLSKSIPDNTVKMNVRYADKTFSTVDLKSHLTKRAEQVLEASDKEIKKNPLVKWQKEKGKPFNLNKVLGFSSLVPGTKNTYVDTPYNKLNSFDFRLLTLKKFFDGIESGSYMQWMGQFGGKQDLWFVEVPMKTFWSKEDKQKLIDEIGEKEYKENLEFFGKVLTHRSEETEFDMEGDEWSNFKDIDHSYLVENYVLNAIENNRNINQWFQGDESSYSKNEKYDFINQTKRAHNILSSGNGYDTKIKNGVGIDHRHLIIADLPGLAGDGMGVALSQWFKRSGVSLGIVIKGTDPIMTSIKDNISYVDENNGRFNFKGNLVNIELLEGLGGQYADLVKFMKEHSIDRISFGSVAKVSGKTKTTPLSIFNENGTLKELSKEEVEKNLIMVPNSEMTYQQDLRNGRNAEEGKMLVQRTGNSLKLNSADKMFNRLQAISDMATEELRKVFSVGNEKAIEGLLKRNKDWQLLRYLKANGNFTNPAFTRDLIYKIANVIQHKILDINIKRIRLQLIPQLNVPLKESMVIMSDVHGEMRRTLFQTDVGVDNVRAEEKIASLKTIEETHAYILKNKAKYPDLITTIKDKDGNPIDVVNDWEVQEEGVIPGEIVIGERPPADGLHSHWPMRVRNIIPGNGNFLILHEIVRKWAGIDFDGDTGFLEILSKKKGDIVLEGIEGLANENMKDFVKEFFNVKNWETFSAPINTDAFKRSITNLENNPRNKSGILKKAKSSNNPMNDFIIRDSNMVSAVGIGIISNLNTSIDYIIKLGTKLLPKSFFVGMINGNKKYEDRFAKLSLKSTEGNLFDNVILDKFIKDKFEHVKSVISNLENLILDNANEQKLFPLGVNVHNIKLIVSMLTTNSKIDTIIDSDEQRKYVADYADAIFQYLQSPMAIRYVELMTSQGVGSEVNALEIYKKLDVYAKENNLKADFLTFWQIKQVGDDIGKVMKVINLVREVPTTYIDFLKALGLINSLSNFNLISKEEILKDGQISKYFTKIVDSLKFMEDFGFKNTIEFSNLGKSAILRVMKAKEMSLDNLNEEVINGVIKSLRTYINAKVSFGTVKSGKKLINFEVLENSISGQMLTDANMELYGSENLPNRFLTNVFTAVTFIQKDNKRYRAIEISREWRDKELDRTTLEGIWEDFNRLPEHWQDLIFNYVIRKYDSSNNVQGGSFLDLISPEYQATHSQRIKAELERWNNNEVVESEYAYINEYVDEMLRNKGVEYRYKQARWDALNDVIAFTGKGVDLSSFEGRFTLKTTKGLEVPAKKEDNKLLDSENKNMETFKWSRYSKNNYEVSTKGDKRFSALVAKLNDGRTIEKAYQVDVKGYQTIQEGKGKPPLKNITREELYQQYKELWKQFFNENSNLLKEIREKAKEKTLTDMFASTEISQARAIVEILNETNIQSTTIVMQEEALPLESERNLELSKVDELNLSIDTLPDPFYQSLLKLTTDPSMSLKEFKEEINKVKGCLL